MYFVITSTKFDFRSLCSATERGDLVVTMYSFFAASLKNGDKCDSARDTCDPYAEITWDGRQHCQTKQLSVWPAAHGGFNHRCTVRDIPNNDKVSIQVWDSDGTDKDLMADWVIPPSDFNMGGKLFVGGFPRKVRGREERNEVYATLNWTPN